MIEIVAPKTTWAEEFTHLAAALRRALGTLALRIDHIGSTSVPGLAAKDIIDMQVTVASFDDFAPVEAALATLGYTLRPDITSDHHPGDPRWMKELNKLDAQPDWEKRYFSAPPGQRPTHLHVRAAGRANQRYALLFRDYLRSHPDVAWAYGEFKQRLALCVGEDRHLYAETKDPVCDIIIGSAEEWAHTAGWTLGPSDA
jgi:GrpB-like predicted nucleotidyltransferase (UPF0157 family)